MNDNDSLIQFVLMCVIIYISIPYIYTKFRLYG